MKLKDRISEFTYKDYQQRFMEEYKSSLETELDYSLYFYTLFRCLNYKSKEEKDLRELFHNHEILSGNKL